MLGVMATLRSPQAQLLLPLQQVFPSRTSAMACRSWTVTWREVRRGTPHINRDKHPPHLSPRRPSSLPPAFPRTPGKQTRQTKCDSVSIFIVPVDDDKDTKYLGDAQLTLQAGGVFLLLSRAMAKKGGVAAAYFADPTRRKLHVRMTPYATMTCLWRMRF